MGLITNKRSKSSLEVGIEEAGVEGPDVSEGFTFVDSTDLQDCPDIDPIQLDYDVPPLPDAENTALSPIAYPEPQQEVISESDTES